MRHNSRVLPLPQAATRFGLCSALALVWLTASAFADSETNSAAAPAWTNLVVGRVWPTNMPSQAVASSNQPSPPGTGAEVREALRQIMAHDDAAQAEADRLLQENTRLRTQASAALDEELQLRIRARFIAVRGEYQQFLARHPEDVEALLAYGGLLSDLGDDAGAAEQWEKARELAPTNPATWNNLANYYAANQNELKAFSYYEKAVTLTTNNASYLRNLGFAIINLRSNAMRYYALGEPATLEKGLFLLQSAQKSLTSDFALATEIGQVLYALKPLRTNELLAAWSRALDLAGDEVERQSVRLHLARANLFVGRPQVASEWLAGVTNAAFAELRQQLQAQLAQAPQPAGSK